MENKVIRRERVGEDVNIDYNHGTSVKLEFFKEMIAKFESNGTTTVDIYVESYDNCTESIDFTPMKEYFESDFEKEVRLALEEEVRQKREASLKEQKELSERDLLKKLKEKYE